MVKFYLNFTLFSIVFKGKKWYYLDNSTMNKMRKICTPTESVVFAS